LEEKRMGGVQNAINQRFKLPDRFGLKRSGTGGP
jgi:hypothetical protein